MVWKGTYRTKEEKARIVMEVLSNSSTISEICRKYNVASSALYRWRDEFIAGGTATMDHGRSTVEASLLKEINELKGIIGELTIANETLKKFNPRMGKAMTELIANGLSRSRSSSLTGVSRSVIYYRHRERKPEYDADLERRISPSQGKDHHSS